MSYQNTFAVNSTALPKIGNLPASEQGSLTRGGKAVKRKRPQWSSSLCNVAAELAGIGQEVRHG